jgi:hypothetical protein
MHISDSLKAMKLDIFSRRKFKCDTCGDKFKTDTEVEQHRELLILGNAHGLFVS